MFQLNSRLLLLPLLGLLLTSCESKVAQCQKIVKIHNQVVLDTQKFTNSGTKGDIKAVLESAAVWAKGAKEMAAIEVGDPKLQEIKTQFTTMYQNSSEAVKQIIDSQTNKKNSEVAKGLANLKQVASPEKNLVDGINSYCQEGQSSSATTSPNSDKK